jgi:predicted phosphatase
MSRRVALGATGAGVLAALTACASDIRPLADGSASNSTSGSANASASASASASPSASASASPSASSGKHYKGLVKFDNFEKNGEYVPATATHKAQNVPKPLVPANMNEQNVDGIYAFVGYWLASSNYLLMTGDTEPLQKVESADSLQNYQNLTVAYENNAGWLYGVDSPMTLELLSDSPQKISGSRTRYDWLAYMNYSADMKIHIEGSPDEPFMEDSSRELTKVSVEYKDGKWIMVSSEDGSSATDSAGGSSSV